MEKSKITTTEVFIPQDSFNEGDKTQFIQFICKQHPEGSIRGFCPRGTSIELPKYVNDLCIKESHVHKGHVVFKLPEKAI